MNDNYYTIEDCSKHIKPREKNTHKGSYGKVGIVAGSLGMTGSVCMSSLSAMRSGSGLVYTIVPNSISDIVSIKLTECVIRYIGVNTDGFFSANDIPQIMKSIEDCDCIVLGPGIGTDKETKKVVNYILMNYKRPIVLDADGLNCITDDLNVFNNRKEPTVITPHPKEFERLLKNSDIKYKDRVSTAIEFSDKYNVITLLKGYNTVIANKNNKFNINPTGNPGMATAGSGDVLAGIIASFIGQGINPYDATCCAAFIHGLAGDLVSQDKGEYGLIATDIIEKIPYAICKILNLK